MRAQPSLIGYIWLLWNEVIIDALSAPIDAVRGSLSSATRTRKSYLRTQHSRRATGIVSPKPEARLGSTN